MIKYWCTMSVRGAAIRKGGVQDWEGDKWVLLLGKLAPSIVKDDNHKTKNR